MRIFRKHVLYISGKPKLDLLHRASKFQSKLKVKEYKKTKHA